jgi:hypothetical protein
LARNIGQGLLAGGNSSPGGWTRLASRSQLATGMFVVGCWMLDVFAFHSRFRFLPRRSLTKAGPLSAFIFRFFAASFCLDLHESARA